MVAQMNRLEHAARIAMGDDGILTPHRAPSAPHLSAFGRLVLAAASLAMILIVGAEFF